MDETKYIKRKMLLGYSSGLDEYSQDFEERHREQNPEFLSFTEGQQVSFPLMPANDRPDHNWYRIRSVLKNVYTKYIRELLQETHDEILFTRMKDRARANFSALKVH